MSKKLQKSGRVYLEFVIGVHEHRALYVSGLGGGARVAGSKPWGGVRAGAYFDVLISDVERAARCRDGDRNVRVAWDGQVTIGGVKVECADAHVDDELIAKPMKFTVDADELIKEARANELYEWCAVDISREHIRLVGDDSGLSVRRSDFYGGWCTLRNGDLIGLFTDGVYTDDWFGRRLAMGHVLIEVHRAARKKEAV